MAKPELKKECIRLRKEGRKTLNEIHRITGASKGSLSLWLRDHQLTKEEKDAKRSRAAQPLIGAEQISKFASMAPADPSRHQKAKIAEAAVLFRLCVCGFEVFGSAFDGDRSDWLASMPSSPKIARIQVKWASKPKRGNPQVGLRRTEGHNEHARYKEGEFDFIAGYYLPTDVVYIWSWQEVAHLKSYVTIAEDAMERWDKMRHWLLS